MDGDAIVMRTEQLLQILEKLYAAFPKLQKVPPTPAPGAPLSKTPEELRPAGGGLTRAYLGVESGSDAVLQAIQRAAPPRRCSRRARTWWRRASTCGLSSSWASPARGRLGGARPVHRRHHQQNEAPPPLSHDFCSCGGHPCWGGRAGRALSGVHPGPDPGGVPPAAGSTWMWTPPLHQQPRLQLPAPEGGCPEDREKFLSLIDQALEGKIRLRKTLNRGI